MKNNLLDLKSLKSFNIDAHLPTHNDFLELLITNKIEEEEFTDITDQIAEIFERAFGSTLEDDEDEYYDITEEINWERLKIDIKMDNSMDQDSGSLYAGYTDCMDEAIRFLIEEENISPEHPIVENLKAHLEKSKERILQTCSLLDEDNEVFGSGDNLSERNFTLNSFTIGNVQSCRDSG